MNIKLTYKILDVILTLAIIFTGVFIVGTPLIVTAFLKSQFAIINNSLVLSITSTLYICYIPYLIALFNLKRISGLIAKNIAFSMKNVNSLKTISICAFSELIIFLACTVYLNKFVNFFKDMVWGIPISIVAFICVIVGLLFLVLSQLLQVAIEIKEENDQTI